MKIFDSVLETRAFRNLWALIEVLAFIIINQE